MEHPVVLNALESRCGSIGCFERVVDDMVLTFINSYRLRCSIGMFCLSFESGSSGCCCCCSQTKAIAATAPRTKDEHNGVMMCGCLTIFEGYRSSESVDDLDDCVIFVIARVA